VLREHLILTGQRIELRPLTLDHEEALIHAASDGELWNLHYTTVPSPVTMRYYIEKALQAHESGREQPFVILNHLTEQVVGTTRYANIDTQHRKREIGYTWLARSVQRTSTNTEAKYLLLNHAFEIEQCIRVEFVTDVLNERSRAALARIGAKEEGVLRNHMIMPDGRHRDSVSFSIIDTDWPAVKESLVEKLNDHAINL
jgi:RimJ/RimL family protein N-acetyltransferase